MPLVPFFSWMGVISAEMADTMKKAAVSVDARSPEK